MKFLSRAIQIFIALLCCGFCWSQAQPTLESRVTSPPTAIWPTSMVTPGERVLVVTIAHPREKQKCKVKSIDADELVCGKSHGQSVSLRKEDVAALIRPAERRIAGIAISSAATAIGGALFYVAICVAMISAPYIALTVPIALAGGVVGTTGLFLLVGSAFAKGHEAMLYQRPGEVLQVTVRG